jgi:hypothetical protein
MENKDVFDPRTTMLSPPEQTPHESFVYKNSGSAMAFDNMRPMSILRGQALPSPPISPETELINPESPPCNNNRDPILFPHHDSSSQPPLFTSDSRSVVDEHMAARDVSEFGQVSPPKAAEYALALEFKSQMMDTYNADKIGWARREIAQLKEDQLLRHGGKRYTPIAPATAAGRGAVGRSKPSTGPKNGTHNGVKKPVKPPKVQAPRGETPEGKKGAGTTREDKDFGSLPDYCPPISSLPNKTNSLKVDWRANPIDLKFDPYAHLLHQDEISLASNLRLDCATYLTSKRRIFIARIECYKIRKEFRKTDAQQACKIDVNKASKLWTAFQKVGWLDEHWIKNYV